MVEYTVSPATFLRIRRGTLIGICKDTRHTWLMAGRKGTLRSMYSLKITFSLPRRETVLFPPGSTTAKVELLTSISRAMVSMVV